MSIVGALTSPQIKTNNKNVKAQKSRAIARLSD